MFTTIRSKIIFSFCVAIIMVCIMFGISGYKVLQDYLVDMQSQNQERLTDSLCSSIAFFREECESDLKDVLQDPDLSRRVYELDSEDEENSHSSLPWPEG